MANCKVVLMSGGKCTHEAIEGDVLCSQHRGQIERFGDRAWAVMSGVVPVCEYDPEDAGIDLTFVIRASMHGPPMPQPGEPWEAYLLRCAAEGWFAWCGDLYHLIDLP